MVWSERPEQQRGRTRGGDCLTLLRKQRLRQRDRLEQGTCPGHNRDVVQGAPANFATAAPGTPVSTARVARRFLTGSRSSNLDGPEDGGRSVVAVPPHLRGAALRRTAPRRSTTVSVSTTLVLRAHVR